MSKPKNRQLGENAKIQQFITCITKKNYAEANKYLQAALDDKLKQRIKQTASEIGF